MKYIVESSLRDFKAWAGGAETLKELNLDEIDIIEEGITECNEGSELTETEINDFLWFETDVIAEWLGYDNWESYLKTKKGEE